MEIHNINNINEILNHALHTKTRANYNSKISVMIDFFKKHLNECPNSLTNSNKKLFIPISKSNLEFFMNELCKEKPDKSLISHSTLNNYISAIKFAHSSHYCGETVTISNDINKFFSDLSISFRKVISQKKEEGVMKNFEGKQPISFLVYKELAQNALKTCTVISGIFIHCFMVLCWNLFNRYYTI